MFFFAHACSLLFPLPLPGLSGVLLQSFAPSSNHAKVRAVDAFLQPELVETLGDQVDELVVLGHVANVALVLECAAQVAVVLGQAAQGAVVVQKLNQHPSDELHLSLCLIQGLLELAKVPLGLDVIRSIAPITSIVFSIHCAGNQWLLMVAVCFF